MIGTDELQPIPLGYAGPRRPDCKSVGPPPLASRLATTTFALGLAGMAGEWLGVAFAGIAPTAVALIVLFVAVLASLMAVVAAAVAAYRITHSAGRQSGLVCAVAGGLAGAAGVALPLLFLLTWPMC